MNNSSQKISLIIALIAALSIAVPAAAVKKRKPIRPGWNLFSPAQDIEMGKDASAQIEKEVAIVEDEQLTSYVSAIGKKLAGRPQAPDYPYTFKVVAADSINAFVLPGGRFTSIAA